MRTGFPRILLIITAFAAISSLTPWSDAVAQMSEAYSAKAWSIPQSENPLPQNVRDFLLERNDSTAKIWVFFTDKGVFNQNQFDSAAAEITLSDKVLGRRAKVNRDEILFVDLPVHSRYVDAVVREGAGFRRASKWLNAASFEIPHAQLDRIGRLPFVAYIKPVGISTHPPYEAANPAEPLAGAPSTLDLNYGYALAQLSQIYVPEVHQQGFNGEGVTLAIFDTGFRKSHEAFALHYAEGRVLDEYDFIFDDDETANEMEDAYNQWDHGTSCWSTAAGYIDGKLYGPAYKANFLLAKTEDVRSETQIEEDNWVAALEWADERGVDVVSSSLAYIDWYSYEDMDGATATTTLAANTAAGLGIVVCNAMANSGPWPGTLHAPADAYDIVACGAVDYNGIIATFSSRGPTYDGRTKPEVCARGVATSCATTAADNSYGAKDGTSLSTPLVAGATCLLIQAHPDYTPQMIRLALMETACNAATPDNNYGWGVVKTDQALNWGANFDADIKISEVPFEVNFARTASFEADSYLWTFGDGETSDQSEPTHSYSVPGAYDVSLTVESSYGTIINDQPDYIVATADTLTFGSVSGYAGTQVTIPINLINTQPLTQIELPFHLEGDLDITLNSITFGERTDYFEYIQYLLYDIWNNRFILRLIADNGGGAPPLEPGSGEVARVVCTINAGQAAGLTTPVELIDETYDVTLSTEAIDYESRIVEGSITCIALLRGDANASGRIDIDDALFIVDYVVNAGPAPQIDDLADINDDDAVDIDDVVYLVEYMFQSGPPPPTL